MTDTPKKRKSPPKSQEDLSAQAYAGLRRMLFLNEITPGQKIHYRDVGERLGMSPTPVIQALKWLEFQGLVRHEANRGFYLEPLSVEEVREIYDTRVDLEVGLLPKVLERLDEEGIARLRDKLDSHVKAVTEQYRHQSLLSAMNFHLTLASLSGGHIAMRFLRSLFDMLYLKYKADILFARPIDHIDTAHQDIFDMVIARDLEGARNALRNDIVRVRDHVVDGITRTLDEKAMLDF